MLEPERPRSGIRIACWRAANAIALEVLERSAALEILELAAERRGRGGTVRRIAGDAAIDDRRETTRHPRRDLAQRWWILVADAAREVRHRGIREWQPAGD